MPRKQRADETVTVRMPKGVPDQLRAITGQPFSRLVRWTMMALLEKHKAEAADRNRLAEGAQEIQELVNKDPRL